ncbi:hypothetical protein RUM43_005991 [Polyplax serrata]|uniref:Uncharacterized protein n=1 Tax=Polyplax serrata TaxID=468196 RepID=A0AAN8S566_POLSC
MAENSKEETNRREREEKRRNARCTVLENGEKINFTRTRTATAGGKAKKSRDSKPSKVVKESSRAEEAEEAEEEEEEAGNGARGMFIYHRTIVRFTRREEKVATRA